MTTSSIPDVLPVREPPVLDVLAVPAPSRARRAEPGLFRKLLAGLGITFGWCWRITVGAFFCMNIFTSVLVTGWTYRWIQARVLRGWWKRSPLRTAGSFEDFCVALGPDAPVQRPRWFWQERPLAALTRRTRNGAQPSVLRQAFRALRLPWHALWLNFKIGLQATLCTWLLVGWGCLIMVFSWNFGWLNSFNKGYEESLVGPLSGFLIGIPLFIAAMFYVPLAQVHQAVTGDARAFFDFRFIWKLIHARLTVYVGLAALIGFFGLILEALKAAPVGFGNSDAYAELSHSEVLQKLWVYLLICCFVLFPMLLIVRLVAAAIYRSAVLKVLRRGLVERSELHPTLRNWLDRLGIHSPALPPVHPVQRVARSGGRWLYRSILYVGLFLIWFGVVAQVYVGEFFNCHPNLGSVNPTDRYGNEQPFVGLLNYPLIQFPCFDLIPKHLKDSVAAQEAE